MSAALSGWSGGQRGMGGAVLGLVRESRGHGELDAAYAGAHQRANLQQLEADGAAGGAGELSVGEADATQGAEQDIGHRGNTTATGWRALFWPRCDRHKGRTGTP